MSFADAHGSGSSSVPAWAARATTTANNGSAPSWAQTRGTEPLVPAFEFAPIKEIQRDLKEIAKAADVLAKLAKKRGDADAAQRMLAVSSETRERARATSRKIRDAFDALADGSSDRASLAALSAEFQGDAQPLLGGGRDDGAGARARRRAAGGGGGGADRRRRAAAAAGARAARRRRRRGAAQQMEAGGLQAIETNDQIIREREAGLRQINQQVHEVSRSSRTSRSSSPSRASTSTTSRPTSRARRTTRRAAPASSRARAATSARAAGCACSASC